MSALPHTVGSEQTITFAQELMVRHKVRHLPVLHGGELAGIVSDRDLGLVAGLNDVNPDSTPVQEAMSSETYVVPPSAPLGEVLREMGTKKYGSAVVAEQGKVVGIFTTTDAVVMLADWFAKG